MIPRIFAAASRTRRPARPQRRGFTLVELLVVIAIIAMLVGLLIPAVQAAREAGRRTTCMNNQQQLGKATAGYASAKEKFPPLFAIQPNSPNPTPFSVGWVPNMLPYIEQNNLYQLYQANTWYTLVATANLATRINTLVCPSRNPTQGPAPLSYVVNAGFTDWPSANTGAATDYKNNGVFFDEYTPKVFNMAGNRAIIETIDQAYMSTHDGTSKTLMLSENLDALDWIGLPLNAVVGAPPQQQAGSPLPAPAAFLPPQLAATGISTLAPADYGMSWWQGFIWTLEVYAPYTSPPPSTNYGMAGAILPGPRLNKNIEATPTSDLQNGRPSSTHPGGFLVTMCDGHSQFMSEDIEYRIYCLLMAPDSAGAKYPYGANPPVAVSYPGYPNTGWYVGGVLIPINDADIQ